MPSTQNLTPQGQVLRTALIQKFKDPEKVDETMLAEFDFPQLQVDFDDALKLAAVNKSGANAATFVPLESERYVVKNDLDQSKITELEQSGLRAIAQGDIAVITLAGGQATRLGVSVPKGLYPLDLGIGDFQCLFDLQAAQIARLNRLAGETVVDGTAKKVYWIVMLSKQTAPKTIEPVRKIAEKFGIADCLHFIVQPSIPAFDLKGGFLIDENGILQSPNGNGGIYEALRPELPRLEASGVKYVHVYCVDNVLCPVGDPVFLGLCIERKADCATKTVEKKNPNEKIGIVVRNAINGAVSIVEYSEISSEQANALDAQDPSRLAFRAGSIANHVFSLGFLKSVENVRLPYHVAQKKLAHVDPSTGARLHSDGIKLERFIFDVFPYSKNFIAYEVDGSLEFSPLKQNESGGVNCPSTCIRDLHRVQPPWLSA